MTGLSEVLVHCRSSTRNAVVPLISAALDFVYPPTCLFCGSEVDGGGPVFCDSCLQKLKPAIQDGCWRCGAPVGPYTDLTNGCGQCRRESFAFDRVIRLGLYDGEMRYACLRAKASSGSSITRGLADALFEQKKSQLDECGIEMVVPIPEHWTRRVFHPHYAAETFSRQIARRLLVRWNRSSLFKRHRTPKQATSSTVMRRQQQQGSFAVRRANGLSGKTILLVDDILTTGSTAHAAARALKTAGARSVIVAVMAVSPLRS